MRYRSAEMLAHCTDTTTITTAASPASNMKESATSIAKESMGTMTNIVCRFFFYVVLVFTIIEEGTDELARKMQVRFDHIHSSLI